MALFPSPLERTVASALLLLSITKPRSPSPSPLSFGSDDDSVGWSEDSDGKSCSEEDNWSLFSASSDSKCSSVTSDGSSREYLARSKFGFESYADCSREMKFKVARKRRSKVLWSTSDYQKTLPPSKPSRAEPTEDSCISTTTSAASSHSETRRTQMHRLLNHREKLKRIKSSSSSSSVSAHLRHQAEAILKMLSSGSSSEVRIRQLLGDSPDTSKALRMLLKKASIKRSGMGGRNDPYIYKIA